jgi:LPS O-antigen subunit length determinant protein (WzzB/FepE family)
MGQNDRNTEEMEIDLSEYIKVFIKRKKTFIAVFLLILAIGFCRVQLSPKIYRTSMLVQPPTMGELLSGTNDLGIAENLKGLIISGAFNDELSKKMNLELNAATFNFAAVIPDKTNLLQVSVDRDSRVKESGIALLRSLCEVISLSYVKRVDAKTGEIADEIKRNERCIVNAKERSKNLQDQIIEIADRENKLREEMKGINRNTAQILADREELLKDNTAAKDVPALLLLNYLQNNSSYLNQVNNQFSDLSIRKVNLEFEVKNIEFQISDFQMVIDRLKVNKDFVSNLKIVAQPKVSPVPISPGKRKAVVLSIVMGLLLGMIAVFLREFWVNNLMNK